MVSGGTSFVCRTQREHVVPYIIFKNTRNTCQKMWKLTGFILQNYCCRPSLALQSQSVNSLHGRLYSSTPLGEHPEQSTAISLSVCLSVRGHTSGTAGPIFTTFCTQIPCGRGLVLPRRRCATLSTSGFMDDVMLGHNGHAGQQGLAALSASDQLHAWLGWSLMSMNACFISPME